MSLFLWLSTKEHCFPYLAWVLGTQIWLLHPQILWTTGSRGDRSQGLKVPKFTVPTGVLICWTCLTLINYWSFSLPWTFPWVFVPEKKSKESVLKIGHLPVWQVKGCRVSPWKETSLLDVPVVPSPLRAVPLPWQRNSSFEKLFLAQSSCSQLKFSKCHHFCRLSSSVSVCPGTSWWPECMPLMSKQSDHLSEKSPIWLYSFFSSAVVKVLRSKNPDSLLTPDACAGVSLEKSDHYNHNSKKRVSFDGCLYGRRYTQYFQKLPHSFIDERRGLPWTLWLRNNRTRV